MLMTKTKFEFLYCIIVVNFFEMKEAIYDLNFSIEKSAGFYFFD